MLLCNMDPGMESVTLVGLRTSCCIRNETPFQILKVLAFESALEN